MVRMNDISEELLQELAFTREEIEQLERAKNMPITFDEDCPETTPEMAMFFHRVNPPRKTTQMV